MTPPRLGARGEGWVALQFVLILTLLAVGVLAPGGWPTAVRLAGAALVAAGLVLLALGSAHLGDSLAARPAPISRGSLRDAGVYARARHPIYGGFILAALGFALATTPWALLPAAALAAELDLKRRVEEDFLASHYDGYAAYRARVPRVFVPTPW
jgi:protein-S-isoprenylcysteine O-methyltransferase Ste14